MYNNEFVATCEAYNTCNAYNVFFRESDGPDKLDVDVHVYTCRCREGSGRLTKTWMPVAD